MSSEEFTTGNYVHHDNDDNFFSDLCFEEGEHVGVSRGTCNFGSKRETQVTMLCIHCNLKLETWKEYPDDFTFNE